MIDIQPEPGRDRQPRRPGVGDADVADPGVLEAGQDVERIVAREHGAAQGRPGQGARGHYPTRLGDRPA